ncbi:unnamed protein product [Phaedon cochleariae]|uniref:Kinesin-like protein n=1 Tax=Phaedon cochleariae TaxID=80249 RepID=A0A9P0DBA0_PHACE|nr:unnamed protein product [Phaedon cochleariae]
MNFLDINIMEEVNTKMVTSFLHARDKSILAFNRAELKNVKVNLENIIDENSEVTNNIQSSDQEDKSIRVYLRLKGGVPYEDLYQIDGDCLTCKVPEGSYSTRNLRYGESITRTYGFTKIFGPDVTQIDIFNNIVKARLLGFINGRNSTLFTYGASGSGKTFTIVGTPEEPGLIPRALEYIFRTLPDLDDKPKVKPLSNGTTQELDANLLRIEKYNKSAVLNATLIDKTVHVKTYRQMQERLSSEPVAEIVDIPNVSVSIWVSFAEIYNENIHDLLVSHPKGKQRPKLALGNSNDQIYIKNLTSVNVSNGLEAYQIQQFGIHNLRYASTAINSHSSRSHSIFTIQLVQTSDISDDVHISSFHFCDLAGSERMKKTMNMGDRLKESNNINTSLLVLGRCIENIKCLQQLKDKRLIPFRESKLTQLFKRALLGYENIEMIVNINPSRDMFDETHHALNFSAIAKEIIVEEQPKKTLKRKNRFSERMEHKEEVDNKETEKLKYMVCELYNEIEQMKHDHEKEIEDEKTYVSNLYKKYYEDKLKRLEAEKAAEIEMLHEKYQLELEKYTDDSVINISSSSNECNSPCTDHKAERKSSMKIQIDKLKEDDLLMKNELEEMKKKVKKFSLENVKLQEECAMWRQEYMEKDALLKDAQSLHADLQEELGDLKKELKALRAQYISIVEEKDRTDQRLTFMYQNSYRDSYDSDEEGNTISHTQNQSTFSQSCIKDEDKKFY